MIKIDLHTHSTASPDGGIKVEDYSKALNDGLLDFIAVTDHNQVVRALELQLSYPKQIIVGEEIMTSEGEIIGLFLSEKVIPGLSANYTVRAIKAQGGLVYIPHPFETLRHGLTQESQDSISSKVDIVEVYNGRAVFQNRGPSAVAWAKLNQKATAASSDAHGYKGLGSVYTIVSEAPTRKNLVDILNRGRLITSRPSLRTLLNPKVNRFRKRFVGK